MNLTVCKGCGKELNDFMDWKHSVEIDREDWCRECARKNPEWFDHKEICGEEYYYAKPNLFRMCSYGCLSPQRYMTSLERLQQRYGPVMRITHFPEMEPDCPRDVGYEHYFIEAEFDFFVFEPSPKDLELMRSIGIEEWTGDNEEPDERNEWKMCMVRMDKEKTVGEVCRALEILKENRILEGWGSIYFDDDALHFECRFAEAEHSEEEVASILKEAGIEDDSDWLREVDGF